MIRRRLWKFIVLALTVSTIRGEAQTNHVLLNITDQLIPFVDGNQDVPTNGSYSSWDLTTNFISLNSSNDTKFYPSTRASFRGAYYASNTGITPTPTKPTCARLTEQGLTLVYALVNPPGNGAITSGTAKLSAVWGYAIPKTSLSDVTDVVFSLGSAGGTYSVIIRDSSSGKYYISNATITHANPGEGERLSLSPASTWTDISNDLSSVGTSSHSLGSVNIDYIGIYNSNSVDLSGMAPPVYTTGYTSLTNLSYTTTH